jgi:hypothetical protein
VGKVTLKSKALKVINDDFVKKSSIDEALSDDFFKETLMKRKQSEKIVAIKQ